MKDAVAGEILNGGCIFCLLFTSLAPLYLWIKRLNFPKSLIKNKI